MNGRITGHHVAAIFVAFFAVVIAVNIGMAVAASRTFGGLVVENSYVASQKFNGWLKEARTERALGWAVLTSRRPDDRVEVRLSAPGASLDGAQVSATVLHPLGRAPERALEFRQTGNGLFESVQPLPAGRWIVHLSIDANGRTLRRIADLS
jgi:nitrogen fixation protein FixH